MQSNEQNDGSRFTLLAVDTAGIQSYIFGSNRLKENIGASYLVKQATEDWAFEAVQSATMNHNVQHGRLNTHVAIEADGLDAEVLYAGGGNFLVLFRYVEHAKTFTRTLSTKVLLEAPGLRLDIYQEEFTWNAKGTGLNSAVKHLLQEMKKARNLKPAFVPLMGLGVTVMCESTALPAVGVRYDPAENPRYVSAEIAAKWDAAENTNQWLNRELTPGADHEYPFDLDNLGRSSGERSYIAVVHADGNGMGALIRDIGCKENNRSYITAMRNFSENVKAISKAAMTSVIALVVASIDTTPDGDHYIPSTSDTIPDLRLPLPNDELLPIRPLVFGGDDTTFVCDGRIALALAVAYLRAFEEAGKALNLTACAGIAIVKSHYPFARAYQLAEELCDEAKKFRREQFADGGSALDWHFTSGGLYDELEEMRKREYHVKAGSLTLRPVSLGNEDGVRNWNTVARLTREFQTDWAEKRNKAKALHEILREGPESVQRFLNIYEQSLPLLSGFTETGWNGSLCGYFDALESMDVHIPLEHKDTQA